MLVGDREYSGIELARAYWHEVVGPLLEAAFPGVPLAAARIGTGSDVLGLDDPTSRDHDWGLRLSVFVPSDTAAAVGSVGSELERRLPVAFRGHPTRFAFTGRSDATHQVDVGTVGAFADSRLGFDPQLASTLDWLSLTGQAALEVTAGEVFADPVGELAAACAALAWYPADVWRHALAADWARLAQELPLMGRAADVGDDLGSRVIGARLSQVAMHLAFLLERRWPPYAKWFGTVFGRLDSAPDLAPHLQRTLSADTLRDRELGLVDALDLLLERQNTLGLTHVERATIPFWDRPYRHPDPAIVTQLLAEVTDATLRALPPGLGTIEQRTDNVDVLVDAAARRRMIG